MVKRDRSRSRDRRRGGDRDRDRPRDTAPEMMQGMPPGMAPPGKGGPGMPGAWGMPPGMPGMPGMMPGMGYPGMPGMQQQAQQGKKRKGDGGAKKKKKKRKRGASSSSSSSSSESDEGDWQQKMWKQSMQSGMWNPAMMQSMQGMYPGMWPGHHGQGQPRPGMWPPGGHGAPPGEAGASAAGASSSALVESEDTKLEEPPDPDSMPIFLEPSIEETVPVPKRLLGKVIGKQAQTIIEIRQKSGAFKVDARDQTTDPCLVKIAGTAEAVHRAKELILDLIDTTRNKNSGAEYVEIPRAKIGMVIGLKGAQADEIQNQTGTKIDVDFETDPCKCYIKGPPENVSRAKTVLLTIAMQIDDANSEYLDLPKAASGALIGAQGSRVREFQELSGARIDVDKTGHTCRVRVSGNPGQVDHAKTLVLAEVTKVQQALQDRPAQLSFEGFATAPVIVPAHQPLSMPATLSESIARAKAAAMAVKTGLVTVTPGMQASSQVPPPPPAAWNAGWNTF